MFTSGAVNPFVFKVQLSLVKLTGRRASNALQLRDHLRDVPESSIYYHTHHFLLRHHFLVPEPSNDFAYWATHILRDEKIGEKLMAIDTVRFNSLQALREALISTLDSFLGKDAVLREAPPGQEFYFMKSVLFCFSTDYAANNLREFLAGLKQASQHSIYYHMFTGRLRTPEHINDFSVWLNTIGEKTLAKQIERLDPYSQTLEGLRARLVSPVEKRISEATYAAT